MGKFIDLTGMRFATLTVIKKLDERNSAGSVVWLCKCDCGNFTKLSTNALHNPLLKSCGCKRNKLENIVGQRFGKYLVLNHVRYDDSGHTSIWRCKCDCGNVQEVRASDLKSGNTVSCGCHSLELFKNRVTKHGESKKSRLYNIWLGMRSRCYYKDSDNYKDYGGRGITVCEEWKDSYEAFRDWSLANGYSDELSIDRIDVNGNYCPKNCRWATNKQQANNTRKNCFITYNGITKTATEWAEEIGIKPSTLLHRKRSGWTDKECIETPVTRSNQHIAKRLKSSS